MTKSNTFVLRSCQLASYAAWGRVFACLSSAHQSLRVGRRAPTRTGIHAGLRAAKSRAGAGCFGGGVVWGGARVVHSRRHGAGRRTPVVLARTRVSRVVPAVAGLGGVHKRARGADERTGRRRGRHDREFSVVGGFHRTAVPTA